MATTASIPLPCHAYPGTDAYRLTSNARSSRLLAVGEKTLNVKPDDYVDVEWLCLTFLIMPAGVQANANLRNILYT